MEKKLVYHDKDAYHTLKCGSFFYLLFLLYFCATMVGYYIVLLPLQLHVTKILIDPSLEVFKLTQISLVLKIK